MVHDLRQIGEVHFGELVLAGQLFDQFGGAVVAAFLIESGELLADNDAEVFRHLCGLLRLRIGVRIGLIFRRSGFLGLGGVILRLRGFGALLGVLGRLLGVSLGELRLCGGLRLCLSGCCGEGRGHDAHVLLELVQTFKASAIIYYRQRRIDFIEYRKELRQKEREARLEALHTLPELERYRQIYMDREPSDSDLANLWPRQAVEEFLKERGLDYRSIREKLAARTDQITDRLLEIRDETEREQWLENVLEDEKKAKLADLISRINRVVGTITDASGLDIGGKGDINGIIIGTEGKAVIETFGVAGYNIVCFHFRTTIREIK